MTRGRPAWDDPLQNMKFYAKGYSSAKIKRARTKKGKLAAYNEGIAAAFKWQMGR
tara:strand:- start:1215 stop:1379 length:165 start_codon:yes stop_codon:yes gene_type:complete